MRLTDEQVMQDNKIFAHHNVLTELKYCGWEYRTGNQSQMLIFTSMRGFAVQRLLC